MFSTPEYCKAIGYQFSECEYYHDICISSRCLGGCVVEGTGFRWAELGGVVNSW
ncbi:hypothetical protein L21SP2_0561 [Salinispira pacifica]|uniref:Uncharacterized protein n=1 Tax=Salinispira pacifica TaxID=1307761 RepID=V5WDW2_9SPIO|nr:hypothetical protein L21SP2_0561 [Salinispira pacifica]